jgi:hypothetical protein
MTLETATPTFGINIPHLPPWNLSIFRPVVRTRGRGKGGTIKAKSLALSRQHLDVEEESSDHEMSFGLFDGGGGGSWHQSMAVSSRGSISATFRVPGLITIPSDGASHNVTIAQLKLEASMSWVTVPKVDPKTHLKVRHACSFGTMLLTGVSGQDNECL